MKCILSTCRNKLIYKRLKDLTLYLSYVANIFSQFCGGFLSLKFTELFLTPYMLKTIP